MIIKPVVIQQHSGYIAGDGEGIATSFGVPVARMIYLFDAASLVLLQTQRSLENGHYMFTGLDADKEYIVMIRDYLRLAEPFAWDAVKPSVDLTAAQQAELWESWQK